MLNGVGSEKGKTKNIKSNQKKTTTLHLQHTFLYISLPLLSQLEIYLLHVLWRKCCMCSQKILLLVFLFAFFFSLPLIFILLATSISHFFTAGVKFSCCCSSNEICPLCFLSLALTLYRSALFLLKLR